MHKAARGWLAAVLAGTTLMAGMAAGAEFASAWGRTGDRVWLGKEYWANPMEDWRVRGGRAECLSGGGDRNVNLLTYSLGEREGAFEVSVRCGEIEAGSRGGVGVRVGIRDDIDDYRGNCFFGEGIDAGIGNGQLYLGNEVKDLAGQVSMADLRVELAGRPEEDGYRLVLTVRRGGEGARWGGWRRRA